MLLSTVPFDSLPGYRAENAGAKQKTQGPEGEYEYPQTHSRGRDVDVRWQWWWGLRISLTR